MPALFALEEVKTMADIYGRRGVKAMLDNDEINEIDEAFMQGYLSAEEY